MSDLLKPEQIFAGRYRVLAFLAKGGFGAVYSAEQIDTEAKVALKVLWPHLLDSDAAVEQFKLEARLSNRIGSEHVVRVYDVGQEVGTGKVYLSMELLEGEDFEQVVKENGPVAPELAAVYLRQIASALEKAHNYVDRNGEPRPIVHRDLKPENLFLTHREAGDPCVKLLDFGLAKVLGESARISGEFKGTPLFMSYEQAAVGVITPQTDVWAFGLVAFYLITGRCYWLSAAGPETPVTRIFSEVLSGPMSAASERARALGTSVIPSAAFDAWFTRAVTRNASRRFGSISECIAELLPVLEAMAELQRPPIVRVGCPPDTLQGAEPRSSPAALASKTLQSVHPPSVETTAQSFDLTSLPRRTPGWRGAAIVAFVAFTVAAGVFLSRRLGAGAASSGGPEPVQPVALQGSRAESPPPALAAELSAPDRAAHRDGGATGASSTGPMESSAATARRKPAPRAKPVPVLVAPPRVTPPAAAPEEDPYGSR